MVVGLAAMLLIGLAYWSSQSQRVVLCAFGYAVCITAAVFSDRQDIVIALSFGAFAFATTVPYYFLVVRLIDHPIWWYLSLVLGGAVVFGLQITFALWLGIINDFFNIAKTLPALFE